MSVAAHELTLTIRVPEWVPGHENRTESAEFHKNRTQVIADGHDSCFGCLLAGITNKTDLQCHHLSEWAEWEDADPAQVLVLAQWLDPYGYAAKIGNVPIADPDDIRLLLMLCQPCHTGAPKKPEEVIAEPTGFISGGIHYCTLIDWLADRLRKKVGVTV